MRFAITKPKILIKVAREANEPEYRAFLRIADRHEQAAIRAQQQATKLIDQLMPSADEIEAAISRGDADWVIDHMPFEEYWTTFARLLNRELISAQTEAQIREEKGIQQFGEPPTAKGVATKHIQKLSDYDDLIPEQKKALKDGILGVMDLPHFGPEVVPFVSGSIGLSPRDIQSIDRQIQRDLARGINPDVVAQRAQISARTKEYQRQMLVAKTELMTAVNAGRINAWDEQRQLGLIDEDSKMEWITTIDDATCEEICLPMDGETVTFRSKFRLSDGTSVLRPPAHPRCRCTIRVVRVKYTSPQTRARKNLKPYSPGQDPDEWIRQYVPEYIDTASETWPGATKNAKIATIDALRRTHAAGAEMPTRVRVVDLGSDTATIARYSPSRDAIEVNAGSTLMQEPKYAQVLAESGWFADGQLSSQVVHEIGHRENARNIGTTRERLDFGYEKVPKKIASKVSTYAVSNSGEFVAETYSGLVSGKVYDKDVMDLYKKYGGVIPK